jgi:hypothetical protein
MSINKSPKLLVVESPIYVSSPTIQPLLFVVVHPHNTVLYLFHLPIDRHILHLSRRPTRFVDLDPVVDAAGTDTRVENAAMQISPVSQRATTTTSRPSLALYQRRQQKRQRPVGEKKNSRFAKQPKQNHPRNRRAGRIRLLTARHIRKRKADHKPSRDAEAGHDGAVVENALEVVGAQAAAQDKPGVDAVGEQGCDGRAERGRVPLRVVQGGGRDDG